MLKCIAPLLTLCLLAGIGIGRADRQRIPEGAIAYHTNVQEAVKKIPYMIGDWVGTDTEIRHEALRILDANITLSRSYRNLVTGTNATLLLVHCDDARSLLGHYPPVCYPSQGWTQISSVPQAIVTEDMSVEATEYTFKYDAFDQLAQLGVLHFTVLPDGRTAPDMQLLDIAARDKRFKFFGGASIQFVVDARLPQAERIEVYELILQAASQWIKQVQSGITQ